MHSSWNSNFTIDLSLTPATTIIKRVIRPEVLFPSGQLNESLREFVDWSCLAIGGPHFVPPLGNYFNGWRRIWQLPVTLSDFGRDECLVPHDLPTIGHLICEIKPKCSQSRKDRPWLVARILHPHLIASSPPTPHQSYHVPV